ncbi:Thioredoxin reductase 1 cytoplasmic [Dissostichus eleginoides]|uniref:Thioredoxin reductase 1 cytoplasmic n=1 Tax=Dissostichus eleginoides TaxID=100907 RepID=A0AAD9CSP2_DISEL|nr:Thioredoxin reductase 1 cytoplasmic [Dissostichus eleginoides]
MDPPTGPTTGSYDYDMLVIGGGAGGLAVAKEAAGLRKKVLILDLLTPSVRGSERELGGSSVNIDSIRKFLQQASLLGKALQDSQKYGWKLKENAPHVWSDLAAAVQQTVETRSQELKRELKNCGVFYIRAHGKIVEAHTVEVTEVNGRKRLLKAEIIVIATGDRPQYLDIPGAREHCVTSEDLLSLPHPPGRTLVVGGSSEGLEFADFLFGLGLPVTVLLQPDLLPGFDQKMAEKIENHMIVSGVETLHKCTLAKVEKTEAKEDVSGGSSTSTQSSKGRLQVTIITSEGQTEQRDFDTVLLSVGSKASTSDLGLECVGVQCSPDGRILVNERDQTDVDHIYAVGSVQHGRPSTTGLAVHAGTLLARRLFREDTALVYHSYYWPLEWELPARNKYSCYVKVICHIPDQERVLGVHILGPNAGDILQGFVAAMKCGLTKQQLDATVGLQPGSAQVFSSLTETQRMTEALMMRGNC